MKKEMKKEIDYRAFFAVGIIFIGVGITFTSTVSKGLGAAFIVLGIVYMIIGGKNKDKWRR